MFTVRLYRRFQLFIAYPLLELSHRLLTLRFFPGKAPSVNEETPPLFSLIMPVYNPRRTHLKAALRSIRRQTFPRWELCLADDASRASWVKPYLMKMAGKDPRIRPVFRRENGHISRASNTALETARAPWLVLMDQDDLLHPGALETVKTAVEAHPRGRLFYSDEDKVGWGGLRFEPCFKSAYDPVLLTGQNCISHLGVYHRELVLKVGGFRAGYEGSQDWDLALRCTAALDNDQMVHIPRVLYSWRVHRQSAAARKNPKPYALGASIKAVEEAVNSPGGSLMRQAEKIPGPTSYLSLRAPGFTDSPGVRLFENGFAVDPRSPRYRELSNLAEAAVVHESLVVPSLIEPLSRRITSGGVSFHPGDNSLIPLLQNQDARHPGYFGIGILSRRVMSFIPSLYAVTEELFRQIPENLRHPLDSLEALKLSLFLRHLGRPPVWAANLRYRTVHSHGASALSEKTILNLKRRWGNDALSDPYLHSCLIPGGGLKFRLGVNLFPNS